MKRKTRKRAARILLAVWLVMLAMVLIGMHRAEAEYMRSALHDTIRQQYPNGLPWATVNAWDVCFRAGPGKEYRVVEHWSLGAAVEVLGEQDGWVQVLRWTSPEPLWVWGEYLDLVQQRNSFE